ncbi:MAG TPA: hypothetical protein VJ741_12815 [Solirubrobacteraceae bacterium]|nr:hypothetical protein [Solirubrobacteraceae bacterium]
MPRADGLREGSADRPASSGAAAPDVNAPVPHRRHRFLVTTLIVVSTLLLIVGIFAVWANRLLFSPDNWAKTSTELLQNPNVRSTTANYMVDQLYANVDVAGAIQTALPPRLEPLAAPVAGALRNGAVQVVDRALTRPRVQALWAQANRAADQAFIATVEGGKGPVGVNQGEVSLNLGAILDNVANRLGLPSNLSSRLPPDAANLTVLKASQLKYVQNGGNAIKSLALWLTILVPVLYGLAVFLARGNRRRTLMMVGLGGILAGAVVLLGRSILETQISGSLTDEASLQTTIRAVYAITSSILADVAGACILGGAVLVLAGWFAGPARPAYVARRWLAPFLRAHHTEAFAVTLAALALLFVWNPLPATGKPAGIIVFTLLALLSTEVLIRQTAREFPVAGNVAGVAGGVGGAPAPTDGTVAQPVSVQPADVSVQPTEAGGRPVDVSGPARR